MTFEPYDGWVKRIYLEHQQLTKSAEGSALDSLRRATQGREGEEDQRRCQRGGSVREVKVCVVNIPSLKGSPGVVYFNSLEEYDTALKAAKKKLDDRVEDWQRCTKPGDCHYQVHDGDFVIYGEIPQPTPLTAEEDEQDRKYYESREGRNKRLMRCYSVLCPEGEFGLVHVSHISGILTREEFELARRLNWPQNTDLLRTLLDT